MWNVGDHELYWSLNLCALWWGTSILEVMELGKAFITEVIRWARKFMRKPSAFVILTGNQNSSFNWAQMVEIVGFPFTMLATMKMLSAQTTQWVRALTALPEDPSSISSTHMVAHTCKYSPRWWSTLFWPLRALQAYSTQIHVQAKHPFTQKKTKD